MPEISLSVHQTRSNCQQSSKETWKLKRENIIQKKRQAVKKSYGDKKEYLKHYKKEICGKLIIKYYISETKVSKQSWDATGI